MAYDCRVYRILIASPSDVEEEREIAVRVIQEWNDLYSYSRKVVLLPLRWETHTAPEFGTRPQEVINRAIVDQCDLLVGIFWTRIGSPTGLSESGTLEEIERVGNAEKPVMLYFSRVEIDPDKIDLAQIEKLKRFKEKTYPKGLTENYKTIIEFRDKFAKQIELKIRDIQQSEATGELPISMEFLSIEKGRLIGNKIAHYIDYPVVTNLEEVPKDDRKYLDQLIERRTKQVSYFPLALAIENTSSSGIRNLYIELELSSDSNMLEVNDIRRRKYPWSYRISEPIELDTDWKNEFSSTISEDVESKLSEFDEENLQKSDKGWRISIEWEALQPQRVRLIKPVLYVYPRESALFSIKAKVFADSFPEPYVFKLDIEIEVRKKDIALRKFIPNWKQLIEEKKSEVW